jgi:hypothetical protein
MPRPELLRDFKSQDNQMAIQGHEIRLKQECLKELTMEDVSNLRDILWYDYAFFNSKFVPKFCIFCMHSVCMSEYSQTITYM